MAAAAASSRDHALLSSLQYVVVVVAPQLIYDQTSSNAGNYTAQGVGNNSCCSKTLPVSADDAARPLVMMMLKHQLEYGNIGVLIMYLEITHHHY